ncbi:MAG TPA: DUF1631 domain-containing protein [Casimicrobiaceae bacterium]|nr:DUF1631 domain-containing protein [Casimicrobiaceae bacterium]
MNATTHADKKQAAVKTQLPRELAKALSDCRDLAIHRLQLTFAGMFDRISDVLMERASNSDIRAEQSLYLDARGALKTERAALMSDFETRLRRRVDDRIAGREERQEFANSDIDPSKLTLVDTTAMDESVLTGNITRIVENACHDELAEFNRFVGHLLGKPGLETDGNPLAPQTIVDAFADALKDLKTDRAIKFQILKELNQASLGDLATIYADLNRHLVNLKVVPAAVPRGRTPHRPSAARAQQQPQVPPIADAPPPPAASGSEVDMMSLYRRMFGGGAAAAMAPQFAGPQRAPPPQMQAPAAGGFNETPEGMFPSIDPALMLAQAAAANAAAGATTFAPMPTTMSGYVPGAPIISTPSLHEGLTRLQAGQVGFEVDGASVTFAGIPQGLHNVLRDLQDSPLGHRANQLESMTIEMVAMLFDYIFDTRDLPDGIKALLARLQIPVLKAAMLDGAFFAKKTHPARLLVNALAQAGLAWSPVTGNEDPLYRKIDQIVHRILDGFDNDLSIFDELRHDLEEFLAAEEAAAEANIASSAEEINLRDRHHIAAAVARSEVERRIERSPIPNFLAAFLRERWLATLTHVYIKDGETSEAWGSALNTLEELTWSVQPKRNTEERKELVALLPSLLKRMNAASGAGPWPQEERESFMSNLVEAHAAAVKPSLASADSPIAAVAEQAKLQAEVAKAAGDERTAQRARALAEAMELAAPLPEPETPEVVDDDYLEIARSLERGVWIEFEADGGQLAFAKLAWVSPLRGTYLFTNRQGQKALSMTAEELATRFREDTARLVEAEPLIDRAFVSVLGQFEDKIVDRAA